jgi:hypothetical protein
MDPVLSRQRRRKNGSKGERTHIGTATNGMALPALPSESQMCRSVAGFPFIVLADRKAS